MRLHSSAATRAVLPNRTPARVRKAPGVFRFLLGPTASARPNLDLQGAHLLGTDGVPTRGDLHIQNNEVVCTARNGEPTALSLLWDVPEYGQVQLETTRLPARPEPYLLPLELARHRLMRINMKREEWGLFDYPGMDAFASGVDAARKLFVQALQAGNDPAAAGPIAEKALRAAMVASDQMTMFHAGVFLNRRHQAAGLSRPFLGVSAPQALPTPELTQQVKNTFDVLRIPFVWRDLQPKENVSNFEHVDAWIGAARKADMQVIGGPLLNFGVRFVPDWMYIWENDFETIFEYTQEHLRRTVKRYADRVHTWIVASGLHADNALAFSFEQIMELTRMAASVTRAAAPRAKILLDLAQPWGEYYARNQQTIPPLLYADMAVQGGINFDGFGVQLVFGLDSDGYHLRDPLQISSLIDRLANLGKQIHVTAVAAPSEHTHATGGMWRQPWTPAGQADWLGQVCEVALSKPYVDCVVFREWSDTPEIAVPGSGLFDSANHAKPIIERLSQLRARLQAPPEK